jgi:DNA-binding SARP family transcriptional activator
MLAQRPKLGPLLRPRPRLLDRLPDSPGWIVWLEAAFGYGKSVLAAQWAEGLESDGWRVLWVSVDGRGVKGSVAALLGLPAESAWSALRRELWSGSTLLVLEDLAADDDVDELVSDVRGLLVLASRGPLGSTALLRSQTTGTTLHLGAADLAFTVEEAATLFDSAAVAEQAWRESGGWSLPLHVAALTGRAAAPEPLMVGVRASLPSELWHELLFHAAVPYVPHSAATAASAALAAAGFTQEIDAGFRLHELMALSVSRANADEVAAVVRERAGRLPVELRAEAYARAGLIAELTKLLEEDEVPGRIGSLDPAGMLRWDELCGGEPGPVRLLSRAWALSVMGRRADAVAALDAVAGCESVSAAHRLIALGWRVFELDPRQVEEAEDALSRAAEPLAAAEPRAAAAFLTNASVFFHKRQEWARVGTMQERAIALLAGVEGNDDHLAVLQHRLAEVRWETRGDLLGYVEASERQYRLQAPVNPYNALVAQLALGTLKALIGDAAAMDHLEAARTGSRHNAIVAHCAAAEAAALAGKPEELPAIAERFTPWRLSFPEMDERIHQLWARTLRLTGAPAAALDVLGDRPGPAMAAERALALAALGRTEEARAALPDPAAAGSRLTRLETWAARYQVSGTDVDLAAIVDGSNAGARVLPHLLPLESLPRSRPELSHAYPIREVLALRWGEAVALRIAEVPPLRVDLLGRHEVTLLGRRVALSTRHKEIIALLALGYDRHAVGLALWPDADKRKVRNNLQVQLTLLRHELEPWDVRTYLGDTGLERTVGDVYTLRDALARGEADVVARLYREPLAAGLDLAVLDDERAQLREDVLHLLRRTAEAEADPARTVTLLDHVLRLDPLDEEAVADQVRALVAVGRRREAQKRYRAFEERLETELGMAPHRSTGAALDS